MDTEEHLSARLPHHDALLARAAELREHLHPAVGDRSLWRLRRRAPVLR